MDSVDVTGICQDLLKSSTQQISHNCSVSANALFPPWISLWKACKCCTKIQVEKIPLYLMGISGVQTTRTILQSAVQKTCHSFLTGNHVGKEDAD